MPRKHGLQVAVFAAIGIALAGFGRGSYAQDAAVEKAPGVVVEGLSVTPSDPGPDTLCQLTVQLANHGTRIAALFGFTVEINGQRLPVYDKELFAFPVDPGSTADLRLFNFWSTETGRPAPGDGELKVEVRLNEARWMDFETEDEVEVWTPAGEVEGLPSAKSVTLKMQK